MREKKVEEKAGCSNVIASHVATAVRLFIITFI
jgi:hypothetical protein